MLPGGSIGTGLLDRASYLVNVAAWPVIMTARLAAVIALSTVTSVLAPSAVGISADTGFTRVPARTKTGCPAAMSADSASLTPTSSKGRQTVGLLAPGERRDGIRGRPNPILDLRVAGCLGDRADEL